MIPHQVPVVQLEMKG